METDDTILGVRAIILFGQALFAKNTMKGVLGKQVVLPEVVSARLNAAWGIFFAVLGGLNLFVAYRYPTGTSVSLSCWHNGFYAAVRNSSELLPLAVH